MALSRIRCGWAALALASLCCLAVVLRSASAQSPPTPNIEAEIARQKQVVDRFLAVLERNPRRGTALDKIYGFHVENGTLDDFLKELRSRIEKDSTDGTAWMIVGLIESQRSRDAAAAEAFTKASELRASDPLAAYYLGQSLVLVGQPEKAAAALEDAIQRKPAQADMLEIFQALGRVHQRAQRSEEALNVWNRLESLFPSNANVQEQIAATLVEEGQLAAALPRYEALAKSTQDDYRRTVFRMEAAELKVKLNQAELGITDFERLLAQLNPDSWLFREVRRKIEEVFLRSGDQDGLAKYYAAWVGKNSEDVEAMGRLARVLARQGRVPEAEEWLNKALRLAPSRKDLRLAFIQQLVDDQRYAEAVTHYVELDKAEPNNPDYLRDWGKVILRDSARQWPERQAAAEKVWRRLLSARPNEALIAVQVADLFRGAELQAAAVELYQKAVTLAPNSPQYREYLGEYYHVLKRTDDALATWRQMAEGRQRTAENLNRLAEVLAQFGYLQQALPEIRSACELDAKDFSLHLKAAELHVRAEDYATALSMLTTADKLAQNDEEREAVLAQQIKIHTQQNRLAGLADKLTEESTAGGSFEQWFLLARYREALRQFPEATRAIGEALKEAPNDIRALTAAARIAEQAGDWQMAADQSRQLAIVDRRNRSEHLQRVATLEAQLGRPDRALAAGNELIAATPGNLDTYQFFADLCFRLNRPDDGIAALRRAVRVNPTEPSLLLALAAALAKQFRTDEAIELYWQAFEKAGQLDDKLSVISKLTDLYLQSNRFEQLLERLERGRREADRRREFTICLAQAHQTAHDYGIARQELERLLTENSRDTQLLLQLSKLAEEETDFAAAVKYQEQLAKLAPGSETEYRLANLLSRAGENQQAATILVRLAAKEEDKEKLLKSIDSLLANGQEETALAAVTLKLRESPEDWELLYRHGVAMAKLEPEAAARSFRSILQLALDDNELGTVAQNRKRKWRSPASTSQQFQPQNPFMRLDFAHEVRQAVGLAPRQPVGQGFGSIWMPENVAFARMAAVGWLYRFGIERGQADAFLNDLTARAEAPGATNAEIWHWIYVQALRGRIDFGGSTTLAKSRRLAERNDPAGQVTYLQQLLGNRPLTVEMLSNPEEDKTPPLPDEELNLATRSLQNIRLRLQESEPQMAFWLTYLEESHIRELMRAGRKEDANRTFREVMDAAQTPQQVMSAMQFAGYRSDRETIVTLFDRFAREDLRKNDNRSPVAADLRRNVNRALAMAAGNMKLQPDEALQIWERYFQYHVARTNQMRSDRTTRNSRQWSNMNNEGLLYWVGFNTRRAASALPATSVYFDYSALGIARTVFEQYRRRDLASDFLAHLEKAARAASPGEKVYYALLLAHTHIWNDDQDAAAPALAEILELAPQDAELRIDIAQYYMQSQQLEEGMAVLDAVAPLDQRVLQRREMLALDLAVRLADQARARSAAQRLYGLRLDAETQMQVAAQMQRLGMHAEAEAVLVRAQRQIGSRAGALVNVMSQYQSDGRMELATEVAHQILRRTRTPPISQLATGVMSSDTHYRHSALLCLSQVGKLKDLIDAAEERLARMPSSETQLATLCEYYLAANDSEKTLALRARLVELKPDEPQWRFAYARELALQGKSHEACDQFLPAVKRAPSLLAEYPVVLQAFKQAKREAELTDLIQTLDVHGILEPGVAVQLSESMLATPEARSASLDLVRRLWEAFPVYRRHLMHLLSQDRELCKDPRVLEMLIEGLLPSAESMQEGPWCGLDVLRYDQRGKITTSLSLILSVAEELGRLSEVRDSVAKGLEQQRRWLAGPAILAIIDLRLGQTADARDSFAALLTSAQGDHQLRNARWAAAQEISARKELLDIAIDLLRRASANQNSNYYNRFSFGPGEALVRTCIAAGRRDEAQQALAEAVIEGGNQAADDPYQAGWRARDLLAIGRVAREFNLPVEGLRAYHELLSIADGNSQQISAYTGRNLEQLHAEARRGTEGLLARLDDKDRAEVCLKLLLPPPKIDDQSRRLDLGLVVTPTIAPLGKMDSLFSRLLTPEAIASSSATSLRDAIARLSVDYPGDCAIHTLAALVALRGADTEAARAAVARLEALLLDAPLEELPSTKRPNSRQRKQAAEKIGVWLVAREAAARPELRAAANRLTERAIEAARRQLVPTLMASILYECGLSAQNRSDAENAAQQWGRIIDLAIVQPRVPFKSASGTQARGTLPATLSQFTLSAAVSRAAAENGMPALALAAIKEALSGGLPVADLSKAQPSGPFYSPNRAPSSANKRTDLDTTVASEVLKRLWELSRAWEKQGLPAKDVYGVIESLVFPASRPESIFLYEQAATGDWTKPKSLAPLLVQWAVRAGCVNEVEQQIASRHGNPTDLLAGEVLATQLALGARNADAAAEHLKAIGKQLEGTKVVALANTALHAAGPAISQAGLADAALPLLSQIASLPSRQPHVEEPAFVEFVARQHLARGDVTAAKSQIDGYLSKRQKYLAQSGDDASLSLRRQELSWAATELARGGDVKLTLEMLARLVDALRIGERDDPIGAALWHLKRQLAALEPRERYELLRDWTLPTATRHQFRHMSAFCPEPAQSLNVTPLSTFSMLVEAAKEAGSLEKLANAIEPYVAEKLLGAIGLRALVQIERRDFPAASETLDALLSAAEVRGRTQEQQLAFLRRNLVQQPLFNAGDQMKGLLPVDWSEYLVARAALSNPELTAAAEKLGHEVLEQARRVNNKEIMTHVALEFPIVAGQPPAATRLGRWHAPPGIAGEPTLAPALWTSTANAIHHVTGSGHDSLFFQYPLTGTFEFSCEVSAGRFAQADLGYGGLIVMPQAWDGKVAVDAVSKQDLVTRSIDKDEQSAFTQLEVKVSPDVVQFFRDGALLFEDTSPSRSSPWLHFAADAERQATIKIKSLRGHPEIPRELALIERDRLDGWNSNLFGQRLPIRISLTESPPETDQPFAPPDPNKTADKPIDWSAEDGQLMGRLDPLAASDQQSHIQYHRPLLAGDIIRYEFFYEPGFTAVHPALGRLAFLLHEDGVRLHWMAKPNSAIEPVVFDPRNLVDEPTSRRGPGTLPLREHDWNSVELRLSGDRVTLRLNDHDILERAIEPTNDCRFGFFHYQSQSEARIRRVVLSGDWPASLSPQDEASLLQRAQP